MIESLSLRGLPAVVLALAASTGCSSGSSAPSGGSASSPNTLACMATLGGGTICEFYEATGADAMRVIASLRDGCTNQSGATLMPLASCPTAGNLGGCKAPLPVTGDPNVTITLTDFFYAQDGGLGPVSAQDVESECSTEMNGTFVASP